jgi:hypothetical protein
MPRSDRDQSEAFHIKPNYTYMIKKMTSFVVLLCMLVTSDSFSQEKPKSPEETVKGTVGGANVEIVYCRPSARGRKMLGGKEVYGQVWRTGANKATTIKFDKAVTIEGKALEAGTYSLWTVPNENEWEIIFNKKTGQWGTEYEKYKDQDVLRVSVKAGKTPAFVETFTITTDKDQVHLQWENTAVAFKVKS